MQKQTPHSTMQDNCNLLFIAFLITIVVMFCSSCATYRGNGCAQHAHMSGY